MMFSRPEYRSEITLMIEELKKQDKTLEKRQLQARSSWWEPKILPDFMRRLRLNLVKQKPYVYQAQSHEINKK